VHPIFSAIEQIAAHCEACFPARSNTIRTARSRTSGENLVALVMTPSSQGLEPPQNPARFNLPVTVTAGRQTTIDLSPANAVVSATEFPARAN
jgi:hypothetical protein